MIDSPLNCKFSFLSYNRRGTRRTRPWWDEWQKGLIANHAATMTVLVTDVTSKHDSSL